MNQSTESIPDVLALPLAEALERLAGAGLRVGDIRETAAPGRPGGSQLLRVARVKAAGEKVDLVVVSAPPGPSPRTAP